MNVVTNWVSAPPHGAGQDHLAVRAISEAIYSELVPCVTNQTSRIRLYGFYPWFVWTFAKRRPTAGYDEFVQLFRRAECLLTMIGARHEQGDEARAAQHGEGLAGRRALLGPVRTIDHGTLRLSAFAAADPPRAERYFGPELGGLGQYYLGTLQTLAVMGASRTDGVRVSSGRGVRLAEVFDASVNGELFWDTIVRDGVTAEVLDACAAFCPCRLEGLVDERRVLVDVLLNRDGLQDVPDMRDPFRLVCDFLLDLSGPVARQEDLVMRFRESTYAGALTSKPWVDTALTKWAAYQRHEFLSVGVQSVFWAVFCHVETVNDEGRLPVLRSGSEVAVWFLAEVGLPELDLTQPFREFLDTVRAELPPVGATQHPDHEVAIARQLMLEEEVAPAVVRACRLLAAVLARLDDAPPYGGFTREESYFRDYPLNLRSLRSLASGRWQRMTVREWVHWLIANWAVGHHLRVALGKLHAQGLDTFRLRPSDLGLLPVANLGVTYSSPRLQQTLRVLRDLGCIDVEYRLSERGLEFRDELHV